MRSGRSHVSRGIVSLHWNLTAKEAGSSTLVYDADFRPYGREHALTQGGNPLYKFDGKLRDTETGLDDFGARYYSFTIGRFMSADWSAVPAPVPYANLTNPQTLNLYAMVSDNPETFADLDGHSAEGATEQSDTLAEDGQPSDCAELEGCAEYEVQYADGPLDTSQAQNNADARNDATVDGTQKQTQPTQAQVTEELTSLANSFGVPVDAVLAVATTESSLKTEGSNSNPNGTTDYGLMRVNSSMIGASVTGADGKPMKIGDDVKTDWKANAQAGVALYAEEYKKAARDFPKETSRQHAQRAYSGYNAGHKHSGRFLEVDKTGLPRAVQDLHFLTNYNKITGSEP